MLERADQLVLDYVSRVADAAHGVLRTEQRLDLVRRVRERVERERNGEADPRRVAKLLTRLGPPEQFVEREVRRLAGAAAAEANGAQATGAAGPADARPYPEAVQPYVPYVVDDASDRPLPGVFERRRLGRWVLVSQATRRAPFAWLRRIAMAGGNPMATEGRDARIIVLNHRRESAGVVLLIVAALLVPFRLPSVAIFPVPLLVWAAAALVVLSGIAWDMRDRVIGAVAPLAGYCVGGAVVGGLRAPGFGLDTLITSFHEAAGAMFIIGTAIGVCWLGFRLLNP
jgi:hypothetical protein